MAIAYVVRAAVVDARADAARASDRFVLDTNVWAWEHYPSSRYTTAGGVVPQAADYQPFLERSRHAGARRFRVAASLAELAHLVERTEHDAYPAGVAPLSLKEYRHNLPAERARVMAELDQAWAAIECDSELAEATHDAGFAASVRALLAAYPLDGYDAVLVAAASAAGLTQVVSDDGDLCCVAGLEVFTANPRALAAARAQGRLASR